MATTLSFLSPNPTKTPFLFPNPSSCSSSASNYQSKFLFFRTHFSSSYFPKKHNNNSNITLQICNCSAVPFVSTSATHYEFNDDSSEVELRLELGEENIISPGEIFVDAHDNSLVIRVQKKSGYVKTLLDTHNKNLYGMIKPSETIWYIDEGQLVVNLKKQDPELKWPDIMESWESLTSGLVQLLKGTSVYIVGESSEINQKVARELAVGLGYTPLSTKELLEAYTKKTIDTWVREEGYGAVAETECAVLESLSSQARTVVATLGGKNGAASRIDKWQHLFAGFTIWLSQAEAEVEESAKEEAKKNLEDGVVGYANAEVVVKHLASVLEWNPTYSKALAQASLSALKGLILTDKDLTGSFLIPRQGVIGQISSHLARIHLLLGFEGRKSLYVRLGCRGDWPDIKPPG